VAFRDGPFENIKVPLVWTSAVAVVAVIVGALALLVTDGQNQASPYQGARDGVDATAGPVGGVLAAPVRWLGGVRDGVGGYFFAVSENRRLKRELAEMKGWRDDAIALKTINARYETLLGLQPEPAVALATARSVAESRGPFKNARILDAGTAKGVRVGNPVINEHGLLGRISGVTGRYSRMVLLTDVASRTPVMIDRTDGRAILTGDGSESPRLEYVRGEGTVQAGDRILSSGDGGEIPRGVPIGVAAKGADGAWRVKLFSDRGPVDFVRVMLFESFSDLVDPRTLNAAPLSGMTPVPIPPKAAPRPVAPVAASTPAASPATSTPAPAQPAASTPGAAQ
jgi:rod shape-determining protein MreC